MEISKKYGDPYKILGPAQTLHNAHQKLGNYKESLEFYKLSSSMSDSLHNLDLQSKISAEKARAEYERQILLEEQAEKERLRQEQEAEQRRNTLQYSGLLIGLIVLFVFVIISGRLQLSMRLTEGLIFFVFLLFFEFLLLFDPYVESWTNRAPAFMFMINSSIALVIFPIHNFVEAIAKKKLIKEKRD